MSEAVEPTSEDKILPFQLDLSDIRGRLTRLDKTLNDILSQHSYPPLVEALVAEATVITALIGQTINLKWKLSLQIRGNGPIKLIATDYFAPSKNGELGTIRAFASFNEPNLDIGEKNPFEQLGKGYFAVLIDQGPNTEPYQGITPLTGGSLHKCAETYFAQSEQLATRFALTIGKSQTKTKKISWQAAGLIIQKMPKKTERGVVKKEGSTNQLLASADLLQGQESENWNRVNFHIDTVEELELMGPHISKIQLLNRLFHEENPRVFEAQSIKFGCTCSADKVRNTMSMYSSKDIETMTTADGDVTADCQFCGAHYIMDPTKLGFEAEKNV
ncbi:MAG: Hsp33 family molecular chaperone HslO [Paracoccaceae bacterium]|jgi:molecular chaperone Hsp33|nr:Hsp33 family molecular chaperone HslO [Paracoccaceae bacterium]|tara:strand:+ start:10512 stop:11504 length:993 start_codon:yes stop_codon:yes gene_type:complete